MERKKCIECPQYLGETCDGIACTDDALIKKMPTIEELTGFLKGSSGKVTVVFNRGSGEFEMLDRKHDP